MKRHVILEDQERPLIWIDHAHRDGELQVSPLQFIGYILAAIAIVGIVWIVVVTYLVSFGA